MASGAQKVSLPAFLIGGQATLHVNITCAEFEISSNESVSGVDYALLYLFSQRTEQVTESSTGEVTLGTWVRTFKRWSTLARSCVLTERRQYILSPGLATSR